MFSWVASVQPAVIGVALVWAAAVKLRSRQAPVAARRSALHRLVGERLALPAYRAVGVAELVLGASLLLPPALRAEAFAAIAVCAGFLGYLGYARLTVPESSCGCLSAKHVPIGVRGFARTGVLLAASVAAATAATGWPWHKTLFAEPILATVVIAGEVAVIAALSSELDARWLLPLRRLRVRLTRPLAATSSSSSSSFSSSFEVPLASTVEQLQRSGVYHQVSGLLASDVRDHWDEGDWRMVCYSARYQGLSASAVFAVPRWRYDPAAVRVALVDESSDDVLVFLDSVPHPAAEIGWPSPVPTPA